MRYIELLLNSNKTSNKKVRLNNGIVRIRIDDELFSGITLKHIAEMINAIHKQYKGIKIPIEFYFGRTAFIDKLTFIIFECMCYDLIKNYGHYIQVFMSVDTRDDIHSAGILSSPLLLLNGTKKDKVKKYTEKFEKDLYGKHFRRIRSRCLL